MTIVAILIPIFLLIAVGYQFARRSAADIPTLANYALFIAGPALVYDALTRHPIAVGAVGRLFMLVCIYTGVLWLLSEGLARLLRLDDKTRRAFILATVPMNVGNYGLPLVRFAFGTEAEPFSVLVFVMFNIPLTTWAIWLAAGGQVGNFNGVRDALKIPIFYAMVVAMAANWFGWTLPTPVDNAVMLLSASAIPVFLIVLGMQLNQTQPGSNRKGIATAAAFRLVLTPVVAWFLAGVTGFHGLERKIITLQTSTPTAVLTLLYALRFGCRPDWIATSILVTTLASAISLGILLYLLL